MWWINNPTVSNLRLFTTYTLSDKEMPTKEKKDKKDRKNKTESTDRDTVAKDTVAKDTPIRENRQQRVPPEDKIIQVPLHLFMRLRNLFEITNAQMNWKSQDLLPVGMIIRDVDRIIAAHVENTDGS